MESAVSQQQNKQLSRIFKEICFHLFGVILLTGLITTIVIYDLKGTAQTEKILVSTLGLLYFLGPASIILYLKAKALQKLDPEKLKSWVHWETINMIVLTIFMGFGTTRILRPPFDFATGTVLLMIIYWLPLFAYKAAQLLRIKKFIKQIHMTKLSLCFI